MTTPTRPGRGWAYTGAILGGLVSIAANVAHSFIPPHTAPADWRPEPGAVVGAIVWPVFLFIAIEILARTQWPQGFGWSLLRWAGLVPVAAVAAIVSYRHLSGLLHHYGEEPLVYYLGPLAVDGLMVMATGALLASGRTRPTLATTVADTFTVSVPRPAEADLPAPDSVATQGTASSAEPMPATRTVPPRPEPAPRPRAAAPSMSRSTTATRPGPASTASATDKPVTAPDAARPMPVPAALVTRAATIADAHRTANGTPITAGELAVRLRVGTDMATQILALLAMRNDKSVQPVISVNGAAKPEPVR